MQEETITIINKLGLHARAATKFANTANKFSSKISVTFADKQIDGKSIMSLMLLAAAKGSDITVSVSGDDEIKAIKALKSLIDDRFGEDE